MLDQTTNKPFHCPKNGTMYHNDTMMISIRPDILHIESLRQIKVYLNSRPLPTSPYGVFYFNVNSRPIELSLSFHSHVFKAFFIQRDFQGIFGMFPNLISAYIFFLFTFATYTQFYFVFIESETRQHELSKLNHAQYFIFQLIRSTEYMSVVLGKSPHSK